MIGMGAILLNRCEIRAGALIPEGLIIPPRSLVLGLLAMVRGRVIDDHVRRML